MVKLSAKQQRIVKAKIEGLKNKEIGKLEYPEATPESQAVLVSRELKKPNVAQYYDKGKEAALSKFDLTWEALIKPISDALTAVKVITSHTEPDYEVPDHTIRLAAAKQGRELKEKLKDEPPPARDPALDEALKGNYDEVQLVRLMKSKGKIS